MKKEGLRYAAWARQRQRFTKDTCGEWCSVRHRRTRLALSTGRQTCQV